MDLNNYKNNGWGLSIKAFEEIKSILDNNHITSVVEFGSGHSTRFLLDYKDEFKNEMKITSFDNDVNYAHKHECVKLRRLMTCSEKAFEDMFRSGIIIQGVLTEKKDEPTTRQRNCFYDLQEGDLDDSYDLVILDGPNGNGRSLCFLHLKEKLKRRL